MYLLTTQDVAILRRGRQRFRKAIALLTIRTFEDGMLSRIWLPEILL